MNELICCRCHPKLNALIELDENLSTHEAAARVKYHATTVMADCRKSGTSACPPDCSAHKINAASLRQMAQEIRHQLKTSNLPTTSTPQSL